MIKNAIIHQYIQGKKDLQASFLMLFNCIYILLIFYKLQAYFSSGTSKISFTSDLSTSSHNKAFISVAGHYIDSEWNLCKTVINFELLKGKHDETNIANEFFDILQSYNIASRVCIYLRTNVNVTACYMKQPQK